MYCFWCIYWYQNINFYILIFWKFIGYWIFDFEEKVKLYFDEYYIVEVICYDNIVILIEQGIKCMECDMGYLEF